MSDRIRILIVDDHAVVRQGLRSFLQLQPDLEVVGEAADGNAALELAARLRPHVVLMDLMMPGGDGIDAIRRLHAKLPASRVLVLSSFMDDAHIFSALQAGATGYLLKDVQPETLAESIRQARRGEPALHPQVASRLVRHATEPAGLADFTPRERDVLKLVAEGFANKEIGRRLFISEKTVKTHVSKILEKLGVEDRTQAALIAVRQHLFE
jgi:NarL family two-component system response regulator LiaR